MKFQRITFVFLIMLCVTACTDNGFLFRSFGTYQTQKETSSYVLGDPYQIDGTTYVPSENYFYSERGDAGWYMSDSDHTITANGEHYKSNELTAMHKTLPLPSIVQITNLNNGKSAIVRVNDRGPYENDRIIDVSEKTAEKLDFSDVGTTPVRVEILSERSKDLKRKLLKTDALSEEVETIIPQTSYKDEDILYNPDQSVKNENYFIQIGAFSQTITVDKIKKNLLNYNNLFVIPKKKDYQTLHCVRIGPFKSRENAMNVLDKIHQSGYVESKIISE